jgi:hydroxymethylbilane synthase
VPPLRLGTRGSALALAQAAAVAKGLAEADGSEPEIVAIRTTGDSRRSDPGDKSRFVKEIEDALLDDRIDLAVHSAKDVPGVLPDGLSIVGVPPRADPRDAIVGADSLTDLPAGARVGTSSLRRQAQILAEHPDIDVRPLRGNVDTRLRRLQKGDYAAIVLALAGLERLGLPGGAPLDALVPAAGQGCLALEARSDDDRAAEVAAALTDHDSLLRLTAERALVEALEADCRTPVGAHATLDDDNLGLTAFVGAPDGSAWVRDNLTAPAADPAALGREVASRLLAAGAAGVLQ